MKVDERVDIKENRILDLSKEILEILLIDRTTGKNIIWATDNYKKNGKGYGEKDKITVEKITGYNGNVIKPRTKKSKTEQMHRTKDKAEVFTPSWICNNMNNLVDDSRLYKSAFNESSKEGKWKSNKNKIKFKKTYTWQDYVKENVLEITCGEAPYLVSRYDTVTGDILDIKDRIGLLDRKLRVVNENIDDPKKNKKKWLEWVKESYKHTYGYEWQGDSLLIARENLLYTFIDYYEMVYKKQPLNDELYEIAEIISWNIWQMDGLKGVAPYSCKQEKKTKVKTLFDFMGGDNQKKERIKEQVVHCKGCESKDVLSGINKHNGIYCKIMDWDENKVIKFVELLENVER